MSELARALKRAAKKWVRPALIPIARAFVRYAPHECIRRTTWNYLVAPYLQYADHTFVATTIFGAAVAGNTQDQIQRYLYYFGVWEPNLTAFVRRSLREGDVFVDVGANVGYFSLLGSKLVGRSGKVVAIEASPRIFARLCDNLKRNRLANVEAINAAAIDREETVKIFLAPDDNIGQTSMSARAGSRYECDVSGKPLDSLISPEDVRHVRLVKIDVEGAEWLVIAGMCDVLRRARSDLEIVVEMGPQSLRGHGKSIEDVFSLYSALGFFPYRIENDYSALSYMPRRDIKRPVRISSSILTSTDVIFSRKDAHRL